MKALLPSTSSTSKSNLMHEPHCFWILQPICLSKCLQYCNESK
jgi:hypothetical protein